MFVSLSWSRVWSSWHLRRSRIRLLISLIEAGVVVIMWRASRCRTLAFGALPSRSSARARCFSMYLISTGSVSAETWSSKNLFTETSSRLGDPTVAHPASVMPQISSRTKMRTEMLISRIFDLDLRSLRQSRAQRSWTVQGRCSPWPCAAFTFCSTATTMSYRRCIEETRIDSSIRYPSRGVLKGSEPFCFYVLSRTGGSVLDFAPLYQPPWPPECKVKN